MKISEVMNPDLRTLNISFYRFVELKDLPELRKTIRQICDALGLKGSVMLSPEGMNGYMAGDIDAIRKFQAQLTSFKEFQGLGFKESFSQGSSFRKMFVKIKKELVPTGDDRIKPWENTGARISPKELKKWLDEKQRGARDFMLVDTRNDYELEHGTFEGAIPAGIDKFRQIRGKLEELSKDGAERPLVMFCTGGIRCEKASVIALQAGFKEVYQLDGGILKYFEECGGEHYRGNCFVFDERVALQPDLTAPQSLA